MTPINWPLAAALTFCAFVWGALIALWVAA